MSSVSGVDGTTDVLVVGGGLGGVAAALAAVTLGRRVVLTEESPWLGGQLTTQAVPPDENPWVEREGSTRTYRQLRERVRAYYRRNYPLTDAAREDALLNPGDAVVGRLAHEPRVAIAAIDELLAPWVSRGLLTVLTEHDPIRCEVGRDGRVEAVIFADRSGDQVSLSGRYVLDATELGDLLELAGVDHVIGAESHAETGEPHARTDRAEPLDQQAISWCFAMEYQPGQDHTIDRPAQYDHWRTAVSDFWPGPQLSWVDINPVNLKQREQPMFATDRTWLGEAARPITSRWAFRRIRSNATMRPGSFPSDLVAVNWPQLDYWAGPIVGVSDEERKRHLEGARQLSLSFLHWMQTEAPRHDGGTGYPGLKPRGDALGSPDHLALRPYIRESRRIRAQFTVTEDHVGVEARALARRSNRSEEFHDSVGIGSYRIDLHPSCGGQAGPRTYVDVASYPFQIPLGALLPKHTTNLLPAGKNIGTTHISNGCYRLHPVEWNIGEAAGALAAHCLEQRLTPDQVRADPVRLVEFQHLLSDGLGVNLAWHAKALYGRGS